MSVMSEQPATDEAQLGTIPSFPGTGLVGCIIGYDP